MVDRRIVSGGIKSGLAKGLLPSEISLGWPTPEPSVLVAVIVINQCTIKDRQVATLGPQCRDISPGPPATSHAFQDF